MQLTAFFIFVAAVFFNVEAKAAASDKFPEWLKTPRDLELTDAKFDQLKKKNFQKLSTKFGTRLMPKSFILKQPKN